MGDSASFVATDGELREAAPVTIKQCCASLYESDAARLLLGDSFHPGGAKLTEHLGQTLNLTARSRVLDVAAGKGTSAFHLARQFRCEVVGIDYGGKSVDEAAQAAKEMGLHERVSFHRADAERLPFADQSFDAVICECAFCTFPNKPAAAEEFARVVRVGGRVGISDVTRNSALTPDLDGLLSWLACIADAQPATTYAELLARTGLKVRVIEEHDAALRDFVEQVRLRLLAADVMVGLRKLALPGFDLESAKYLVKNALNAITEGQLGYAIVVASKEALGPWSHPSLVPVGR
jgi:ubiquinone/menaquinone biosynthesis C-methylase UbiE